MEKSHCKHCSIQKPFTQALKHLLQSVETLQSILLQHTTETQTTMAASGPACGVVVNIIYKRTPEFKFDMEYFLQTHIPLAAKAWAPYGLLDATVTEAPAESEYAIITNIRFKTLENWQKAMADTESIGPLLADVPNFTNGKPDFVVGTVVKGGIIET